MAVTTTPEVPGTARKSGAAQQNRIGGGLLDPKILWKSTARRVQEAGPAGPGQEPGHVRRRGRRRPDHLHGDHELVGLQLDDRGLALADRALRQSGRGRGRGPGQGAGRNVAPDEAGYRGTPPDRLAGGPDADPGRRRARHSAQPRRPRGGRGWRDHPRRRRRRRGRRVGRRVGDHRRVGSGDPRVGRRSVRGHRRHEGPVRQDRGARSPPSRARPSSTA